MRALLIVIGLFIFTSASNANEIKYPTAPEIAAEQWLNSPPLSIKSLQGKVVLVEFWTFGCWNCEHIEPYVKSWYKKYKKNGLIVIGIHTPEFAYEKKLNNVKKYLIKHEINHPIAIDNDSKIWRSYHNQAWPTIYLIDKKGNVRYRHIGEGNYKISEKMIQKLLHES